jgi:pyruvate dehydrogenase E2 component (dihydrolipoamide acetyltransferase)
MAKILDMPKLSPTMEEGVLSAWHKKEGDAVEVDDLLAEVETDKATMEFRAFDRGTLLKTLVAAGANVKLGQPVAILGAAGEDIGALIAQAGAAAAPAAPAAGSTPSARPPAPTAASTQATLAPATSPSTPLSKRGAALDDTVAPVAQRFFTPPANPLERTAHEPPPAPADDATDGRVRASPYVRKVARELGVDLRAARGTGPHGRIVAADVEAIKDAPRPAALAAAPAQTALARATTLAEPETRPLSMMRKTIARRLTESKQTVPHFYLTIDVDADALVRLRETINAELGASAPHAEDAKPLKVSVNDLLVKACAAALVRVPECNATFTPDAILVHRRVDISVAVAVPEGLLTPVVRDADKKSVVAIAREVRELAARARAKKLKPEEMTDGTFSISNLGMFGIDSFSAVINPPEGAILAVGQVREEPVVREGQIAVGKRLAMTLSCDHRVIDGAIGAAFLAELRGLIEHPLRVLTG